MGNPNSKIYKGKLRPLLLFFFLGGGEAHFIQYQYSTKKKKSPPQNLMKKSADNNYTSKYGTVLAELLFTSSYIMRSFICFHLLFTS